MGKHSRHYADLNPLEGGGSGGGSGRYKASPRKSRDPDEEFLTKVGVGLGTPAAATGVALAVDRLSKNKTPYDDLPKKDNREAAAEIKRESRGKEDPMTAGQKQSMQEAKDEEAYQKRKTAPTTKTEMGKAFAKGGMTASSRADGIAQRGKTRGKMC